MKGAALGFIPSSQVGWDEKQTNSYLNLGDRMTVFRCGWNRSWYLRTCIVEDRLIVINIENINSDNGLPLTGRPAPLSLYIENII